ncbi:MAG: dolichyl-phosphate-mannose-protein mannosyltransferase [Actinomycetota bacterium]|nr:dolichyl-phosphate-mannose-protein mannosyltransferase [Actinomycetota bacterium]
MISITAVGAALRLWRVAIPSTKVFDETYYARDACWYVKSSISLCGVSGEQTTVHPPLGKWLISVGIRFFGYNSFGWRISSVVAGVVTIALLYVLARKILHSTLGAAFCTALFAIDFMDFVQSRTSMLDIFVPLFGVAAVLAAALDRDRLISRRDQGEQDDDLQPASTSRRRKVLDRRWRVAAGAFAGAATACKWSGGFILVAVVVLSVAWEIGSRRAEGLPHPFLRMLNEEGASIVICLGLLPVAVYMLTYIGRLDGTLLAWPWTQGAWLRAWWDRQLYMESFHHNLTAQHSYESPAWTWLLLKRPVSYYFTTTASGKYDEIFASADPFVWWAAIPSLIYVAVAWVRSRDFAAPEGLILTGFSLAYAPWLLPQLGRPAIFLFYLLPALPFMYLALGYVAVRIGKSWEAQLARALFAVGAIGLFAFYYPLLAAVAIPQSAWNDRVSVFNHCDKPPGPVTTSTITSTIKGSITTSESKGHDNSNLPPTGWCWI